MCNFSSAKTAVVLMGSLISLNAFGEMRSQNNYENLKQEVLELGTQFGDCFLMSFTGENGFTLSVDAEKKIQVTVSLTHRISMLLKSDSDGAYEKSFKIEGVGNFTFIHASELFDSVTFEGDGQSATCKVEF